MIFQTVPGMQFTAPVYLTALTCLRNRSLKGAPLLPVGLILIGLVLFMASGGTGNLSGNLIAASEGIFYTGISLSARKAGGDNPLGLTALACLITGIGTAVLVPDFAGQVLALSGRDALILVILGVVQVSGGYGLYNMSLSYISPERASILGISEMILSPVWMTLFLHVFSAPTVIAGLLFLLAGMLLDAVPALLRSRERPTGQERVCVDDLMHLVTNERDG